MCDFQPGLRILHVSGKDNAVADALSHRPDHFQTAVAPQVPLAPQLGALQGSESQPTPPAASQSAQFRVVTPISPATQAEWQASQEADASLEGVRQAAVHGRGPFILE